MYNILVLDEYARMRNIQSFKVFICILFFIQMSTHLCVTSTCNSFGQSRCLFCIYGYSTLMCEPFCHPGHPVFFSIRASGANIHLLDGVQACYPFSLCMWLPGIIIFFLSYTLIWILSLFSYQGRLLGILSLFTQQLFNK